MGQTSSRGLAGTVWAPAKLLVEFAECNHGDCFVSTHSVPDAVPGPGTLLQRSEASLESFLCSLTLTGQRVRQIQNKESTWGGGGDHEGRPGKGGGGEEIPKKTSSDESAKVSTKSK